MAKIVLLNPPSPPGAVSNKDMMGGFGQLYKESSKNKIPPIDLAYAGAVMRANGVDFKIVEALGENLSVTKVIHLVGRENPVWVAVRTSTPTFYWDLHVCSQIKEKIGCMIALFGPHCMIFPDQCISNKWIDVVVLGEPEYTLCDIATKDLANVCGIYFKHGGDFVRNVNRQPIENLDALPYPAWDSMPYQNYSIGALMRHKKPFVTMLSSRGCPFGCHYCPYPVAEGLKWRAMSAGRVVDEMEFLISKLGIKAVLFRDPVFSLDKCRVEKICNEIVRREIKVAWRVETRVDCLDAELIEKMAKAGCIGINFGIESGDVSVLKNVGRKTFDQPIIKDIVEACKKWQMDTFLFFIIGLPGDSKATILKTLKLAKELDPEFCQFTVATPYPGTKLAKWASERGYITRYEFSRVTGYSAVMRNENLRADEIETLTRYATFSILLRRREILRRMGEEGLVGLAKNAAVLLLYLYHRARVGLI